MTTFRKALTVMFAASLAFGAHAGEVGSRNDGKREIDVAGTIVAFGAKVPRGSYTLRWIREAGTENVKVELTQGRKVLASGGGVWVAAEPASPYEAIVYDSRNGAMELTEIRFRRSTDLIRLETAGARAAARPQDDGKKVTAE